MSKFDKELDRMRAMMNFGLKTEDKNQYKSVEYQRLGADGKMYGIVREGTKYYIKVSNDANSTLKENFDYVGGFRNRKDYEYSSYANALKNFDMKMKSIKESKKDVKDVITESWNLDTKKGWTTETTEKMRNEIERQREIMNNAKKIFESKGKPYSTNVEINLFESKVNEAKSCDKVDSECSNTQKNNIKKESPKQGDATSVNGNPFTEEPKSEDMDLNESEQVLGWNDNKDYLDTSHGTEIGDGSPFNEEPHSESEMNNGVIDEGVAMHNSQNQNSPEVGTSEVGDTAPFEKKVTNELSESSYCEEDDVEMDDFESEEEPMDDFESEEEVSIDEPMEDEDGEFEMEIETEDFDDDMESRISAMEDLLSKIAEKLGVDSFEDDSLYDDESMDDFESEDDEIDFEDDFEDDEDDFEVYESVNYRKMMNKLNEDRLDYFGKHPAYQKEPMGLPSNSHQEKEGYYDMNDDSVKNDSAYGQSIGSGAPFEIDPQTIENSIAESIKRIMKKKI